MELKYPILFSHSKDKPGLYTAKFLDLPIGTIEGDSLIRVSNQIQDIAKKWFLDAVKLRKSIPGETSMSIAGMYLKPDEFLGVFTIDIDLDPYRIECTLEEIK